MTDAPRKTAVVWAGLETVPVLPCNSFVVQYWPSHEFVLSFGFGALPLPGAEDHAVTATSAARLTLSHGRVVELIELLRRMVERFEQEQQALHATDDVTH